MRVPSLGRVVRILVLAGRVGVNVHDYCFPLEASQSIG